MIALPEKYRRIAYVLRPHGVAGELVLNLEQSLAQHLDIGDFIFLEIDACKVPFQILEIRGNGHHFITSLEFIETREQANSLSSLPVFVDEEVWQKLFEKEQEGESISQDLFVGYQLLNDKEVLIGNICSILELPENPLFEIIPAEVTKKSEPFYVPIVDEWILNIDHKSQKIYMQLPEGLTDL